MARFPKFLHLLASRPSTPFLVQNQGLLLQIGSWLDKKVGLDLRESTELVSIILKTFSDMCNTSISPETNLTESAAH